MTQEDLYLYKMSGLEKNLKASGPPGPRGPPGSPGFRNDDDYPTHIADVQNMPTAGFSSPPRNRDWDYQQMNRTPPGGGRGGSVGGRSGGGGGGGGGGDGFGGVGGGGIFTQSISIFDSSLNFGR